MITLPFFISLATGFFFICLILKDEREDIFLKIFLGAGLGLGISSHITFFSFLIFDEYNRAFLIIANLGVLALSAWNYARVFRKKEIHDFKSELINPKEILPLGVLLLAGLPLLTYICFYPLGGWDAWSCWNFKARFLFLAGDQWKNMFDPLLWRSSPHYPLLLPLLNVWGWSFLKEPLDATAAITAFLFTILTAGLLYSSLRKFTGILLALLTVLPFLSLPFFIELATSQYSDIVVAYFLLGSFLCLILARRRNKSFSFLAGIFLGFLSFSKNEGQMAALILFALSLPYLWQEKNKKIRLYNLKYYLGGFVLAFLPTLTFTFLYAPANHTFINGLTSPLHPATLERAKIIAAFLLTELISQKWNGLWIVLFLIFASDWILNQKKYSRWDIFIFPLFLFLYGGAVCFYYFLNTYFEITWWLSVTLSRILFSILPATVFWVFYSKKTNAES